MGFFIPWKCRLSKQQHKLKLIFVIVCSLVGESQKKYGQLQIFPQKDTYTTAAVVHYSFKFILNCF